MKKRTWDEERARQLFEEGSSDVEIADMVGASVNAIVAWRNKEGLHRRRKGGAVAAVSAHSGEKAEPVHPELPAEKPEAQSVEVLPSADNRGCAAGASPRPTAEESTKVPDEEHTHTHTHTHTPAEPAQVDLSLSALGCEIWLHGDAAGALRLLDLVRAAVADLGR